MAAVVGEVSIRVKPKVDNFRKIVASELRNLKDTVINVRANVRELERDIEKASRKPRETSLKLRLDDANLRKEVLDKYGGHVVEFEGDFDKLKRQAEAEISDLSAKIEFEDDFDSWGLSAKASAAAKLASRYKVWFRAELDTKKAMMKAAVLSESLRDVFRQRYYSFDPDTLSLQKAIKDTGILNLELDRIKKSLKLIDDGFKGLGMSEWLRMLGESRKSLSAVKSGLRFVRAGAFGLASAFADTLTPGRAFLNSLRGFASIANVFGAAMGVAASSSLLFKGSIVGVSAVVGYITDSVKQLSRIGLLIPGILGGVGMVGFTLFAGFRGLGSALSKAVDLSADLEGELTDLAPSAANFARAVRKITPAWKQVAKGVQQNMFEGMGELLVSISEKQLPTIAEGMGKLSTSTNGFFKEFGKFAGAERTTRALSSGFTHTNTIMESMRDSVGNLMLGLQDIGVIGLRSIAQMSRSWEPAMERFAAWTDSAQGKLTINRWIDDSIQGFKDLGATVGNLYVSLREVGNAFGIDFDSSALETFREKTERFREWIGSADDANSRISSFAEATKNFADPWIEFFTDAWVKLKPAVQEVLPLLQSISDNLTESLGEAVDWVAPKLESFFKFMSDHDWIGKMIAGLLGLRIGLAALKIPRAFFAPFVSGLAAVAGGALRAGKALSNVRKFGAKGALKQAMGDTSTVALDRAARAQERAARRQTRANKRIQREARKAERLSRQQSRRMRGIGLWGGIKEESKVAAKNIGKLGKASTKSFGGFVKTAGKVGLRAGSLLGKGLLRAVPLLGAGLMAWDIGKAVFNNWDSIKEYGGKAGGFLKEKFGEVGDWIKDKWNGLFKKRGDGEDAELMLGSLGKTPWSEKFAEWDAQLEGWRDKFRGKLSTLWDGIQEGWSDYWSGAGDWLTEKWNGITSSASETWDGVRTTVATAWDSVKEGWTAKWEEIGTGLSEKWISIKEGASESWSSATTTMSTAWDGIKESWLNTWSTIETELSTKWDSLKTKAAETWSNVQEKAGSVWDTVSNGWTSTWDGVTTWLGDKWTGLKDHATSTWTGASDTVNSAWDNVSPWWSSAWSGIQGFLSGTWSGIKSEASSKFADASSSVISAWSAASSSTSSNWSSMQSVVAAVAAAIQAAVASAFQSAVQIVVSSMAQFVSSITSGVGQAVSVVASLPGRIMGAMGNLGGLLVASGRSLIQGFISGISSMVGAAVSAARGVVSAVRGLFPFSPAKYGPFSGKGYTTYSGKALIRDFGKGMASEKAGAVDSAKRVVGAVQKIFGATSDTFVKYNKQKVLNPVLESNAKKIAEHRKKQAEAEKKHLENLAKIDSKASDRADQVAKETKRYREERDKADAELAKSLEAPDYGSIDKSFRAYYLDGYSGILNDRLKKMVKDSGMARTMRLEALRAVAEGRKAFGDHPVFAQVEANVNSKHFSWAVQKAVEEAGIAEIPVEFAMSNLDQLKSDLGMGDGVLSRAIDVALDFDPNNTDKRAYRDSESKTEVHYHVEDMNEAIRLEKLRERKAMMKMRK